MQIAKPLIYCFALFVTLAAADELDDLLTKKVTQRPQKSDQADQLDSALIERQKKEAEARQKQAQEQAAWLAAHRPAPGDNVYSLDELDRFFPNDTRFGWGEEVSPSRRTWVFGRFLAKRESKPTFGADYPLCVTGVSRFGLARKSHFALVVSGENGATIPDGVTAEIPKDAPARLLKLFRLPQAKMWKCGEVVLEVELHAPARIVKD